MRLGEASPARRQYIGLLRVAERLLEVWRASAALWEQMWGISSTKETALADAIAGALEPHKITRQALESSRVPCVLVKLSNPSNKIALQNEQLALSAAALLKQLGVSETNLEPRLPESMGAAGPYNISMTRLAAYHLIHEQGAKAPWQSSPQRRARMQFEISLVLNTGADYKRDKEGTMRLPPPLVAPRFAPSPAIKLQRDKEKTHRIVFVLTFPVEVMTRPERRAARALPVVGHQSHAQPLIKPSPSCC